MFSLVAMSSRRRSSRVSLTSSSMTACDCSLSKSATKSRSASHRSKLGQFNWLRESSSAYRRAVDARAQNCHSARITATSVSMPHVAENQRYCSGTWMRWTRAMGGPLSKRNSSIYVEPHWPPMTILESLSAQLMYGVSIFRSARAAPRATRCRCGSVPPANKLTSCPSRLRPNT